VPNPDYDASHWWRYSEGVKDVLAETVPICMPDFSFIRLPVTRKRSSGTPVIQNHEDICCRSGVCRSAAGDPICARDVPVLGLDVDAAKVDLIKRAVKRSKASRILVLGLAYKPNVDDERESPSYVLMDLLNLRRAKVEYYDPYIPAIRQTREHSRWTGKKSVPWNREVIETFDVVLIATNHACVNYQELAD